MRAIVRSIVTSQGDDGEAAVTSDELIPIKSWPGADAGDAVIWSTPQVPADNSERDLERDTRKVGNTIRNGSIFRITELGPCFRTPMHRTQSLDYCFVISGELELLLDGEEAVRLGPGDAVVQRGTMHAWANRSNSERCRFVVTMIESDPITMGGKTLNVTPTWKILVSSLFGKIFGAATRRAAPGSFAKTVEGSICALITGHNSTGSGIIEGAEFILPKRDLVSDDSAALLWGTTKVPPSNCEVPDFSKDGPSFRKGTAFKVVDLAPESTTVSRRPDSIEYCFLLNGDLELILNTKTALTLHEGETLVQRGVRYELRNPSPLVTCRLIIVSITALKR